MSVLRRKVVWSWWIAGNVVLLTVIRTTTAARSDEIELRDGARLQGVVVTQTLDTVTIGTKTLPVSSVLAITIEGKRRKCRKTIAMRRSQEYANAKTFTGLSSKAYGHVFKDLTSKGYQPVAIRGYAIDGIPQYDVTMAKGRKWKWFARHNCSHAKFIKVNDHAEATGYSLTIHSQFRVKGKAMHAAVWELPPRIFHDGDDIQTTGTTAPACASIGTVARTFVCDENIPGMAIAIARRGRLVYARGFGYADVDRHESVQPGSLFRIASVSKPIMAVAAMQLIEQKKLAFDTCMVDVLRHLLPKETQLDPRCNAITVRHLLQHTSGWGTGQLSGPTMVTIAKALHVPSPPKRDDVVRYWLGRPLDFTPGEHFEYGNFNYCVLGRIIEQVTGQRYEAYVRNNVLAPLGIKRMQIGKSQLADRAGGEVRYYTRYGDTMPSVFQANLGKMVPVQYGAWDLDVMDGNGGWIASAIDLVTFASALYDAAETRVLSQESVRQMFAPPPYPFARTDDGQTKKSWYAFGWSVSRLANGKLITKHNGRFPGTSALLIRRPDGLCWAVLCNIRSTIDAEEPVRLIASPLSHAIESVRNWPEGTPLGQSFTSSSFPGE